MTGNGESLGVTTLRHKRVSGVPPSPLTLAEWVNWGFCPPEALHEAGRLYVDLTKLAPLRAKLGTDVRLTEDERHSPALKRVDVNADRIILRWGDDTIPMSVWLNSLPLAGDDLTSEIEEENKLMHDRVIRAVVDDLKRGRRNKRPQDKKVPPLLPLDRLSSLDDLVDLWNDTPETVRPAHFPLDPVVGALVGSRVSLGDYLPTFRRYQQDVRRAVDRDKEMNGQDARNVLLDIRRRDIEKHDLLIGLLRAGADPLVEKLVGEYIEENLIPQLGTLDDVNHGRVVRAFDHATRRNRSYGALRKIYDKARRDQLGRY